MCVIQVSKEEAEVIRKELNEKISSTCVQRSSRGKHYAPETQKVFELLKRLRNSK